MLVSPDTSDSSEKSLSDDSSHLGSTGSEIDEFDASTLIKQIAKSDHKIAEEGFLVQEPLLKENPHRFVLFPIEDNEVSQLMHSSCCVWCSEQSNQPILLCSLRVNRFGKCTKRQKLHFGLLRRLILLVI
jgi:hypothetical protein